MKFLVNTLSILIFSVITLSGTYAISPVNKKGIQVNDTNIIADSSLKIEQKTDSIQIIYNKERDHVKITMDFICLSDNNQWLFIEPSGEVYKQGKINSLSTGMYQITINTKKLQSGEYTFQIKDNDLVISKKITIEK